MIRRLTLFCLLLSVFCLERSLMSEDLKVGSVAPEFTLPGTDGKNHKLSDFKNKQFVVVAWYPKALTGG